jgi:hypothetical protein
MGDAVLVIIDTNSVDDKFNDKPYLLIAGTTPYSSSFEMIKVSSSAFEPDDNKQVQGGDTIKLKSRATIGTQFGAFGNFMGNNASTLDLVNTLTVDLIYGTLSSITDDELFYGDKNAAVLGREGIRFGTVEYLGEFSGKKRYKLSRLLRGQRGTESYMDDHGQGDAFVLIDNAVKMVPYRQGAIGTPIEVEARTDGEDVMNVAYTPLGRNLWPYSGQNVLGARDGSNTLTVSWARRSRYTDAPSWQSGEPPILGETSESYSAEILNSSGTIVREFPNMSTPSFTYTAADQTIDFGSPQSSVKVRMYQLSEVVGKGYPVEATV